MKAQQLQNRILFYSPTVQAGWERQSHRLDFELWESLGEGSFGKVFKVKHKKNKKIYAIKQIKKLALTKNKLIEHARTEIKIMYSLNHPNIIKLYNHFQDQTSIYLVLQYAGNGNLLSYLQKKTQGKFIEKQAAQYIRQIAQGLTEIHKNKIMHRDLKLQNILVNGQNKMKIADFGWSHFQSVQERHTFCGTLDYLAPEMLKAGHKHDYRVDLWSVGVLVYELCAGESPFSSELIKLKQLTEQRVFMNIKTVNYRLPEYLSQQCKDLIRKLLILDPKQRLQAHMIIQHNWIKNNSQKQAMTVSSWLENLRKQVQQIFPENNMNQNPHEKIFSKEQIYNYTRPDSIINYKLTKLKPKLNTQKQSPTIKTIDNPNNSDKNQSPTHKLTITSNSNINRNQNLILNKKLSELELKVANLQKQHEKDRKEINRLLIENQREREHRHCQQKIRELMAQLHEQNKKIQGMNRKLIENETELTYFRTRHN